MAEKKRKPAAGSGKNKKAPVRPKTAKQGLPATQKNKAGKAAEQTELRDNLAKELRSLIPRLDAEGLQFLIEQAQVHLYNMQVDELNEALARPASPGAGAKKTDPRAAKPPRQSEDIRIEGSGSGSSFYLFYHGQSVMFSRDEIIHLVKVVNGPGTALEIAERLFNWFDRERADVFALIPMNDYFDARLKKIAQVVKKNFKVQPKK
jgi:hypothetical protein